MFNSALIYELAVLKMYAEPLLFGIGKDEPEYQEAKRLLKFLDCLIIFFFLQILQSLFRGSGASGQRKGCQHNSRNYSFNLHFYNIL